MTAIVPPNAPVGHPPVAYGKTGVLIANLGTPDATDYFSMRRYLKEFLSDRRVIDYPRWKWWPILNLFILTKRPFTSGAAYRGIWNIEKDESPLHTITRSQTEKLAARLAERFGDEVVVDFAMRYGNPSTASKVKSLIDQGCRQILFFPLYPQYSAATTATANDAFFAALMDDSEKWQPTARTIGPYHDHPLYIEALARSVETALAELDEEPEVLVASYHGLPVRYLHEGDPYYCHCMKTSRLLRERLGWPEDKLRTAFQSRFGKEEWLQPYTVEEVARLAREEGVRHLAIMAPAFATDCVETLEEINEEIRDAFLEAGGERFTYIPCLNDDEAHIALLARLVEDNLAGWVAPKEGGQG